MMPTRIKTHRPLSAPSPAKKWHKLYGRRWQKASKQFLTLNPLCVSCQGEGVIEAAAVVDHVEPHRGDLEKFWTESNWQALCKRCHDSKTASEDGGFGK